MIRALVGYFIVALVISLCAWSRRPPGRNTSRSNLPKIKSLVDFDNTNPEAKEEERELFYEAVMAQLGGDLGTARAKYEQLLRIMRDEKNTLYNLKHLEDWAL